MSLKSIFRQLHDRASWPAVPERVLVGASADDLRPAGPNDLVPFTGHLVSADLVPWTPPIDEG
jgi:hypothetical protein